MSYVELDEHPRKAELLCTANTLKRGRADGELMKQMNPKYIKMVKEHQEKMKTLYG